MIGVFYYASRVALPPGSPVTGFQYYQNKRPDVDVVLPILERGDLQEIQALYQRFLEIDLARKLGVVHTLFIECVFEAVRRAEFPNQICRWGAVHACPSPMGALAFAQWYGSRPFVYRVLHRAGMAFSGDMALVNPPILPAMPFEEELLSLESRARRYWRGEMVEKGFPEVLLDGDVVVEELVQSLPVLKAS